MLTFLRKIRKSFIQSGNVRKYLLYAIGEIALVVIGILIALSINNWNQVKITKVNEQVYLKGLKTEYLNNKILLDESMKNISENVEACTQLANLFNRNTYQYDEREVSVLLSQSFFNSSWAYF